MALRFPRTAGIALAGFLTAGAVLAAAPAWAADATPVRSTLDAPGTAACATTATAASTGVDAAGWSFAESKSGGHHEYVDGGLHVWTDAGDLSLAKSAGYVGTNFPLSAAGAVSMDFSKVDDDTVAAAGINLTLFEGTTWKGNLVFEPLFDKWWISKPIAGLPAGPNPGYQKAYGTLDEIIAAYGTAGTDLNVRAVGYSLGSGAVGDEVIHSITAGCTTFTFDLAPVAATPTPTVTPSVAATVPPKSSDDLTAPLEGKITVSGNLVPGGTITVTAPGHAGETVDGAVYSAPRLLGTTALSAQATATFVLPADLPTGQHRVALYAANGTVIGWATITVGAQLAATGVNATALALGGSVALLAGSGLLVLARRRTASARA